MILADAEITTGHDAITAEHFVYRTQNTHSYGTQPSPFGVRHKKYISIGANSVIRVRLLAKPDGFYLAPTREYTQKPLPFSFWGGKNGRGAQPIHTHTGPDKAQIGNKNHSGLYISRKAPVSIYAGVPMGQLIYFQPHRHVMTSYAQKEPAKYTA